MFNFGDWPNHLKLDAFDFDLSDGSCGDIRIGNHIDCLKSWGRPIFSAIGMSLDYRESGIMVKLDNLDNPHIAGFLCFLRPAIFRPKPDFQICPLRLKIPGKNQLVKIKPGAGEATLETILGVIPVRGGNPAHGLQLGFKFPGAWLNFDYGDDRDFSFLTITQKIDFFVPNRPDLP